MTRIFQEFPIPRSTVVQRIENILTGVEDMNAIDPETQAQIEQLVAEIQSHESAKKDYTS